VFMSECFIKNEYSTKEMLPNPSKWNCSFCSYKEDKKLCGLGEHF
jgi:CRISPR/Cas system-associated exonuclease Cas4 (RecB family)